MNFTYDHSAKGHNVIPNLFIGVALRRTSDLTFGFSFRRWRGRHQHNKSAWARINSSIKIKSWTRRNLQYIQTHENINVRPIVVSVWPLSAKVLNLSALLSESTRNTLTKCAIAPDMNFAHWFSNPRNDSTQQHSLNAQMCSFRSYLIPIEYYVTSHTDTATLPLLSPLSRI